MKILSVTDRAFSLYGKVLAAGESPAVQEFLHILAQTPLTGKVVYRAEEPSLETCRAAAWLQDVVYGEMPLQIGWCNGYNRRMDAMEYHKASEVNLAGTDLVLMLGRLQELDQTYRYRTEKARLFFIPKGTLIEIYGTTLHYAPCHTGKGGFRCMVALSKGTNMPLARKHAEEGENRLLFATNKWLIGHPDAELPAGCFRGLLGENITLSE